MRLTLNRGCVVTGAAVLALLAGSLLSVAQEAVRPMSAARPGVVAGPTSVHQPFVSKALPEELKQALSGTGVPSMIAVSDFGNSFIDIFNDSGTVLATLTGNGLANPQGMATDRLGNLYVANSGGLNILTYAAGFTAPPTAIADPDGEPADVAQRNNGGFLGVTNIVGNNGAAGSVTFYRNGNHVGNVTDPSFLEVFFGAFDHAGNYYFDGLTQSGTVFVAEIAHATTGGRTVQFLTTTNTIGAAFGVQVTNAGLIAILDEAGDAIFSYNPPVGGSLGSPVDTTPLNSDVGGFPLQFAFKVHNHNMYVSDATTFVANEYAYPAGGTAENTISIPGASDTEGVAVIPVQMP